MFKWDGELGAVNKTKSNNTNNKNKTHTHVL